MPTFNPSAGDVHVNKMLTDISIGYVNGQYIADQIFPLVTVNKQTDIIPQYKKSAFFRDEADVIAEGGIAPDTSFDVDTTSTYACIKYGIRHFISDDRRANEDDPFNADRDGTLLVTDKLMMRRERAFVADFWKTSTWKTDVVGGTTVTKWSDYGSSTPLDDIATYKRTIRRLIGGIEPNTLVLGDLTYDRLRNHPDILERIQYSQMGIVDTQLLATLFGVSKILVGKSVYTATGEGTAEASVSYTANWDDDALLLYVPERPSLWSPAAGYTFVWNTGMGGAQWIRKYRDEERMGDFIEVRSYFDQKALSTEAGVFFSDIVD